MYDAEDYVRTTLPQPPPHYPPHYRLGRICQNCIIIITVCAVLVLITLITHVMHVHLFHIPIINALLYTLRYLLVFSTLGFVLFICIFILVGVMRTKQFGRLFA
jgi:hypothetical protein